MKPYTTEPLNPLLRIFNRLSPIAVVPIDDDPVRQALIDIRFDLPQTMSQLNGVKLNNRERSQLQKYLAEGRVRERLARLVASPKFKGTLKQYKIDGLKDSDGWEHKDAWFYEEVRRIFREEKEIARIKMRRDPMNRPLMLKIEAARLQKSTLKQGNTGSIRKVQTELQKHGI